MLVNGAVTVGVTVLIFSICWRIGISFEWSRLRDYPQLKALTPSERARISEKARSAMQSKAKYFSPTLVASGLLSSGSYIMVCGFAEGTNFRALSWAVGIALALASFWCSRYLEIRLKTPLYERLAVEPG